MKDSRHAQLCSMLHPKTILEDLSLTTNIYLFPPILY